MAKKLKLYLTVLLLAFCCMAGKGVRAEAAQLKTLKANVTYTTKLTGSKSYRVLYREVPHKKNKGYKNLEILVNGKVVKEVERSYARGYVVQLVTVNSKRNLLAITDKQKNGYLEFMNLYEYKNGKFVFVANLCDITRSPYGKANKLLTFWARGSIQSFSGNRLTVTWHDSTTVTGNITMNVAYTIKGNKVTKVGTSNEIRAYNKTKGNPKWTSKYEFTTYTTVGGKKKAFTVKKNEKVTLKSMTVRGGRRYIKFINAKGKAGWMHNPMTVDKNKAGGYFWECTFAN